MKYNNIIYNRNRGTVSITQGKDTSIHNIEQLVSLTIETSCCNVEVYMITDNAEGKPSFYTFSIPIRKDEENNETIQI